MAEDIYDPITSSWTTTATHDASKHEQVPLTAGPRQRCRGWQFFPGTRNRSCRSGSKMNQEGFETLLERPQQQHQVIRFFAEWRIPVVHFTCVPGSRCRQIGLGHDTT